MWKDGNMESFVGRSFDVLTVQEQHRKKGIFLITALICILVCAALGYLGYQWFINREYGDYQVEKSVRVENGVSMNYISCDDGLLRYGRDGVTVVDDKGNSVWSGSYDMGNPRVDACGSSVVVADIGEKALYVHRQDGTGTDFTVDFPVLQACVSRQGVVAVLMEDGASNSIALYNPFDTSQKLLAEIPTNVEDGYPVSIDLSPDGTSVVAAYLCVTTGIAQSRVAFYNFTDVGKNTNCLVGAHNYDTVLISEVRFMDNNMVCLFGDKSICLWGNMKKPEMVHEQEFTEDIQSAFCGEKYFGVLLNQGEDSCAMQVFDLSGSMVLDTSVEQDFHQVAVYGDEILLSSAGKCAVYRINGVRKFYKKLDRKISYFFPSARRNRYFFVQDSKIKVIRLKA